MAFKKPGLSSTGLKLAPERLNDRMEIQDILKKQVDGADTGS